MTAPSPRKTGGWSLVELAVVLVVMGVLGLALWRILPLAPEVAAGDAAARDLARAEQALLGYALAHSRLPDPVMEDGRQLLPVKALGLPARFKLHYQVQSALSAAPTNLFRPYLPPDPSGGSTALPPPNGLDLCMGLKSLNDVSLPGMDGVPTAFALMHRGRSGPDNPADSKGFALPGSKDVGGRRVLAVGPGELASRLDCPARIASARAAARSAYAAHDMVRVAESYYEFRTFAVRVARMNKTNADVALAFASVDMALAVTTEAIAILQASPGWPPDPAATAAGVGVTGFLATAAGLASAAKAIADAAEGVSTATGDLDTAERQQTEALVNIVRMETLAQQKLARARYLDQAGLQP